MEDLWQQEFQNLKNNSSKQDTRYYQLVFFTLAAFGVIFGFYNKIDPQYLVPLMLYIVLYFTATASTHSRQSQLRSNAFLHLEYYLKDHTLFFSEYYISDAIKPKSFFRIILTFIKDPFVVFNLVPIAVTILEIKRFCTEIHEKIHIVGFWIVIGFIAYFQIQI